MLYLDRVKESSTSTGTGAFILSGTDPGYRTFSSAASPGVVIPYCISGGVEWEIGEGVMADTTTLTRSTITASSNGGALVNFSAGTKTVFCTVSASSLANMLSVGDISYTSAVPLTNKGIRYMPQQSVAGAINFTVAGTPVKNAQVYIRLVANGVNTPTFSGMLEWGGSSGFDNRSGITNSIIIFYDGNDVFYTISQAVGATATDTTSPTATSAAVANGAASQVVISCSETLNVSFTPATTAFTVSGHTVSSVSVSGTTITLGVNAFVNGEATRSITYTQPGSNQVRDVAGNLMASFTGLTVVNNVGATATAPSTMAAPTASAGNATATVTLVAPSDGGSAITGYTVVSSPAGGVDSNAGSTSLTHNITGLTNGVAYTFTATATNNVGTSSASPASNSVTPAVPSSALRLTALSSLVESGSSPDYVYTCSTGGGFLTKGGVLNKTLPAGDGSFAMRNVSANDSIMAVTTAAPASSVQGFASCPHAFWNNVGGSTYGVFTAGSAGTVLNTMTAAVNDIMRLRRSGSTLVAEVARSSAPDSFTTIYIWNSVSSGSLGFEVTTQPCSFDQLTGVNLV